MSPTPQSITVRSQMLEWKVANVSMIASTDPATSPETCNQSTTIYSLDVRLAQLWFMFLLLIVY